MRIQIKWAGRPLSRRDKKMLLISALVVAACFTKIEFTRREPQASRMKKDNVIYLSDHKS